MKKAINFDKALLDRINKGELSDTFNSAYNDKNKKPVSTQYIIDALCFFTKNNIAQIKRIFKTSPLCDQTTTDEYLTTLITKTIERNEQKENQARQNIHIQNHNYSNGGLEM